MDENNKVGEKYLSQTYNQLIINNEQVKVTEIFDMTDDDSPEIQSLHERETNQQLQFDTELDGSETGRDCKLCINLESPTSACVCIEVPPLT